MLTKEELLRIFDELGTPEDGKNRIQWIRENAPIRRVGGSKKAVKVRYVPLKMPFVLEAEGFNTEYAALITYDNDKEIHEIYVQPTQLKISYINRSGKKVSPLITPDIFLIQSSGFFFVECKTEEELSQLAKNEPNRYQLDESGRWRSLPAEAAAKLLGCNFILRSTKENKWELIENLEFLSDYITAEYPEFPEEEKAKLRGFFASSSWATVEELIRGDLHANADLIYSLIVKRELYFDLMNDRLSDYERALVFRDQIAANAYRTFARSQVGLATTQNMALDLDVGSRFQWDGRSWEIVNKGDNSIGAHCLDNDEAHRRIVELTRDELGELARLGKISVPHGEQERKQASSEAEELIKKCSPDQLRKADLKYQVLFGESKAGNPYLSRQKRARAYWLHNWREAESRYGNGLIGLIENLHHTQGNRSRKIADQAVEIIATSIQKHWETPKRKRLSAINGEVRLLCREAGIEIPSIKTLYQEIIRHKTHKALVARVGDKAAYSEEPEYLVLDYTTPRHGTRPFHIGHIDHTPVDLVLLDQSLKKVIKSLWLTFLIDAYSRKILAFYLSYDPPSYRTDMMILRECVRRHGRLPKFIVVDGGPDFNGTYFELALSQLKTHKKERPGGKARFGSLIERVFKTTQEQFIYSLLGNTQSYENFRQISPEIDPVKFATWSMERLRVRLGEYLENVYHKNIHGTLGCSPGQMFMEGLTLSGSRANTLIPYNQNFLIMTCPTTAKGTACVTQHGVKINYLFYRAPVLSLPGMKGKNVPIRYEPFNRGIAYAYVNNQWHELYSEHYAIFKNYSEKAIRIASEYLHLMSRYKDQSRSINAERLAAFLRSTDGEELLQNQLQRESESKVQYDTIVNTSHPASTPMPERSKAFKVTPIRSAAKLLEDF